MLCFRYHAPVVHVVELDCPCAIHPGTNCVCTIPLSVIDRQQSVRVLLGLLGRDAIPDHADTNTVICSGNTFSHLPV